MGIKNISYIYANDNYFSELKNSEIFQSRLELLEKIDPFSGKYFSKKWVCKNILHQTEDEQKEIDREISKQTTDDDPLTLPGGAFSGGFRREPKPYHKPGEQTKPQSDNKPTNKPTKKE